MPLTFQIEKEWFVITGTGTFGVDDLRTAFCDAVDKVAANAHFAVLLIDMNSSFLPSASELRTLSGIIGDIVAGRHASFALVVNRPVHFGLGRMLEVFVTSNTLAFSVFRDEHAARQWLSSRCGEPSSDTAKPGS